MSLDPVRMDRAAILMLYGDAEKAWTLSFNLRVPMFKARVTNTILCRMIYFVKLEIILNHKL